MKYKRKEKLSDIAISRNRNTNCEVNDNEKVYSNSGVNKIIDELDDARRELDQMFRDFKTYIDETDKIFNPESKIPEQAPLHTEVSETKDVSQSEESVFTDDKEKQILIEETVEPQQENTESDNSDLANEEKIVKRNTIRKPMIIAGAFLIMFLVLFASARYMKPGYTENKNSDSSESVSVNPMDPILRNNWLANKEINDDFIGEIIFDSGLVDLLIVQADDVYQDDGTLYEFYSQDGRRITDPVGFTGNEVYIWSNWISHKYDGNGNDGAVFMDYRNALTDQNLILYGHHIARDYDPSGDKEFTPLDLLLEEENYSANKDLKIILDNEIRHYVVASVFTINAFDQDEIQIIRTDLNMGLSGNDDPGFLERYFEIVNDSIQYDTGVCITENDNVLTLVTCIQHQPQYRELILCKEINRTVFTQ